MRFFKNKLPNVILIGLGLLFIHILYGKILWNPNEYIFSHEGDGIKNYFTYAYHIKHGQSSTNFEGMNYPYGENYLFTDCHPFLARSFKNLAEYFPFFQTYSVGILNVILILSIFFTLLVVYKILRELKQDPWLSIIFSLAITLLAPQILRITGHFALSYSFAFPLTWLLILKSYKNPRKSIYLLLLISNLFWMFIHAYLGMILLSFILAYLCAKIIIEKKLFQKGNKDLWLLSSVILPIILFYLHLGFSDTHIGRTDNPSGFFLYNAELDDILLPSHAPFRPYLDQLTGGKIRLQWEARGYLGMMNTLLFLSFLIMGILSIFKKKLRIKLATIFSSKFFNISLLASVFVLLFAMGIPFKQFPDLLDIFPAIKQFRATGRFVWPFYFVFTIFSAVYFMTWQKKSGKKSLKLIFVIIIGFISCFEGYNYHKITSKSISKSKNIFAKKHLSDTFHQSLQRISPEKYQGIIALPFYHSGSENFSRPRQAKPMLQSMVVSYHTGIPLVNSNLARTSIEESKRIIQIISPNYYPKPIQKELKDSKPFLILKSKGLYTKYENILIEKAQLLQSNQDFDLLEISPDILFKDDKSTVVNTFNKNLSSLKNQGQFLLSDSNSFLFYNSFENLKSDTTFRGNGAFASCKKGKNTFAEFLPNTFKKHQKYNLSLWMYHGEPDALNKWFRLIIEEYDEKNNQWYSSTFFPVEAEVFHKNWSLMEVDFEVRNPQNRIYIVSKGKENSKASLHIDDLLVKEKGVDVYQMNASSLFYNNHIISTKDHID
ncbi:MAG: hypothetical protein N4A45_07470 [Flavobacteriales bacterium]|jgi:hypothetical protein|nr:hypothetical protein [Flavobacteriales bacterium]